MKRRNTWILTGLFLSLMAAGTGLAADNMVATAVSGRVGNGYKREQLKDGSFKPEFYALANGGRIDGTGSDVTVDRIQYPEVAEIAMRLLARQNYHYARSAGEATQLLVLHWGVTIGFNNGNYATSVNNAAGAKANLQAIAAAGESEAARQAAEAEFETRMMLILMENRVRDQINLPNAKVLGYVDELNESNDIRRWAGGGDRYNDLVADVEEARYYIIVSAYDFEALTKKQQKKLLWQTRVSVRAPGNRFDDSMAAMLKGAAKYFGRDSGPRIVRGEETKGTVEMGDLKILGEAKEREKPATKEKK